MDRLLNRLSCQKWFKRFKRIDRLCCCLEEESWSFSPSVFVGRGDVKSTKDTPGPSGLRAPEFDEQAEGTGYPGIGSVEESVSFSPRISTGIETVKSGGFTMPTLVTMYSRIAPVLVKKQGSCF